MFTRNALIALTCTATTSILCACSMKEEMRRIEEVKKQKQATAASRSTNLTGEQVFIRSCNECHPHGGKSPEGPTLLNMDKDYPSDRALVELIRKGKGRMPAEPSTVINDQEMTSLVAYLRQLNETLHEKENAK